MKYKIDFLYKRKKSIEFGLTLLGMPKVLQNYKSGIYSKDRYVQISHWSHCSHWFQISPMISLFSVDLSLLQLVSFLMEKLTVFFLIFCDEVTSLLTSKSWLLYCCRNSVCSYLGKKRYLRLIFLETAWKENYCHAWLSIPVSLLGKVLDPELLSKTSSQMIKFYDSWKSSISRTNWAMKSIFRKWATNSLVLV